jgi:TolA-binding protein
MKFKSIFLILVTITAIYAEQSVYSDSDFIDPSEVAKKNSREIFILKQKISQLKETIEGLRTIINGQNSQIEQLKQKLNASANLEKVINELSQRVAALESRPVAEPKQTLSQNTPPQPEVATTPKTNKETSKEPKVKVNKKLNSKDLYKQAVLDFTKSKLTKAQSEFKELLKRSYKRAAVNFYLGEIAYKKGRYKEAISYYQNSATLNENASYMDKLLLHTAIALKKKGKSADAKVFFKAVIDGYPNSNSAKEAKKYMK